MSLELPSNITVGEAERLAQAVIERINAKEPVAIDGGQVERIGLAGLQVLLAARASAIAAGLSFSVDPCSNRLADMADLAGLDDLVVH
ncbi:hypothetical protein GCM10022600_13920 [Qipengyuania pelagi]|jgi:anti-anti-sigma regulatory factor|uniref:STAS domain-containing protein n=1 Tax=Qipengyuania pelagi TaxID=994320 RepID=A0A844Y7E0_9SPHN|nr:STAS domain-containing protein [Qipengyuania pelagi]MEC7817399.1 STAS domain-containing protein [Pseudomonadota bacterium]MXO53746.1 STAS domain-containing protein [Qipengyuania pelagi]